MLFNASERKGIFCLLFLICSIFVVPRYFLANEPDFFLLPAQLQDDSIFVVATDTLVQAAKTLPLRKQRPQLKTIELNQADSATLVKIRGIGPYYAAKIIRYREQLGGFYSIKQLHDLKMKYFNVDSNLHLFTLDTTRIQVSDLDSLSFKELVHHPYLSYEDVQMIFNAKRKYGHITCDTLKKYQVLSLFKLKKIKPYFK